MSQQPLNQQSPDAGGVPPASGATSGRIFGEPTAESANLPAPATLGSEADAERWITLSRLRGMPLVDLTNGSHVGTVDDVVLSSDYRYIEGYLSRGGLLRHDAEFPAEGATIGRDAITIPAGLLEHFDRRRLAHLPRGKSISGLRLLTDTGRRVGLVRDLRFDRRTGALAGYEFVPEGGSVLDRLRGRANLLPLAAIARHGRDALIVGEDHAGQYIEEH